MQFKNVFVGFIIFVVLMFIFGKRMEAKGRNKTNPQKPISSPKPLNNQRAEAPKKDVRPQYMDKFQLLNKSELILFERLKEAVPALHVFTQVSMSQLFHITNYRKGGYIQLGEIGRKSIDFLICRTDTSIILAIELNGPTHDKAKQKASDEKKEAALIEAGIPLLIIKPDAMPEVQELRRLIAPHFVERRKYETERDERMKGKKV